MQQRDYRTTDHGCNYMRTRIFALETATTQMRHTVENGLLLVLVCAFWGLLIYWALSTVL